MLFYLVICCVLFVSTSCDQGQPEVLLFNKVDTDNNDQLTRVELDNVFLLFDNNTDGKVSPDEFVAGWTGMFHIGGRDEAQTLFTRADTNDDGYIDSADIPAIFTFFDIDGDGLVDISEFLTQWGQLELTTDGNLDVSVVAG